jgi:hypothetical protein
LDIFGDDCGVRSGQLQPAQKFGASSRCEYFTGITERPAIRRQFDKWWFN